jgi:hypothetical protein
MPGPTVVRNPVLTFKPPTGEAVDVSCHVRAVALGEDAEVIDVATFCNPAGTEVGKVTSSCTVAVLWSPELYTALQPLKGQELGVELKLAETDTKAIMFSGRFSSMPWGSFEVGARVESDLVLAVLSPITYDTPSAPAGA